MNNLFRKILYFILIASSILGIVAFILQFTKKTGCETYIPYPIVESLKPASVEPAVEPAKRVAYIDNWIAFPSGTFSKSDAATGQGTEIAAASAFAAILRSTTHLVVAFIAVDSFGYADSFLKKGGPNRCAKDCKTVSIGAPGPAPDGKPWYNPLNSIFIAAVRQINSDIKIMISFGGAAMGCCAAGDEMAGPTCPPAPTEVCRSTSEAPADGGIWHKQKGVTAWDVCLNKDGTLTELGDSLAALVTKPDGQEVDEAGQFDGIDFDYEWISDSLQRSKDEMTGRGGRANPTELISQLEQLTQNVRTLLGPDKIISHAPRQNYFYDTKGDNYSKSLTKLIHENIVDFIFIQMYNGSPTGGECTDTLAELGLEGVVEPDDTSIDNLCKANLACCKGGAVFKGKGPSEGADACTTLGYYERPYRSVEAAKKLYDSIVDDVAGGNSDKVVWGCLINDGAVKNFTGYETVKEIYSSDPTKYKNWGFWEILASLPDGQEGRPPCVKAKESPLKYVETWITRVKDMTTSQ